MAGHRFNPERAHKLHSPERLKLLPPETVVQKLGVTRGETVADLGAGSGYFTLPLAQATEQTVYAVDIEPKMLVHLQERATAARADNIAYVESDLEHIQLATHAVDKVIAAFVLHEVADLAQAFAEIKRIMKPDGRALVLEWMKKETESGPPLGERIPVETFAERAQSAGFRTDVFYPNEQHYGLVLSL
ncbi:class I SAM-dependent methyltransferase [Numidum massiliense]|uniref:class I SAM-dependent methyltransferase n=1 Tax=Numidum massiliense TaxID=1522315 RepID=UPI00093AC85B|nr:class I SAM-dependent methyltransferase [Numidum massiliense]